ncbi:TPA: hypothetical protein ACJGUQ_003638 [Salmonella enterica subsp. enterica serovar Ball]
MSGNILTLTAGTWGETAVTVTTPNGVTAVLSIRVVAEAKVIMRLDSTAQAMFFVNGTDKDFTIDYGDGVDSRDYRLDGTRVLTTRDIPPGTTLTLTVKNTDSVMFFPYYSGGNPLLEIIRVSSQRTSMVQFAKNHSSLRKIHLGAFDCLPEVTSFSGRLKNARG